MELLWNIHSAMIDMIVRFFLQNRIVMKMNNNLISYPNILCLLYVKTVRDDFIMYL